MAKLDSNPHFKLLKGVFIEAKLDSSALHVAIPDSDVAENDSKVYF